MIGLLSDSHDNLNALKQIVDIFNTLGCSLVIHAGDFVAPFAARELSRLNCPFRAVFGNCDGEKEGLKKAIDGWGIIQPAPYEFTAAGLKFHLRHIALPEEEQHILQGKVDVYLFGHTHKPFVEEKGDFLIINPGEAGGWLSGKCSYALLDPATKKVTIHYL
mgnify:CR=1 FL=1|jgi:hypothetical protein